MTAHGGPQLTLWVSVCSAAQRRSGAGLSSSLRPLWAQEFMVLPRVLGGRGHSSSAVLKGFLLEGSFHGLSPTANSLPAEGWLSQAWVKASLLPPWGGVRGWGGAYPLGEARAGVQGCWGPQLPRRLGVGQARDQEGRQTLCFPGSLQMKVPGWGGERMAWHPQKLKTGAELTGRRWTRGFSKSFYHVASELPDDEMALTWGHSAQGAVSARLPKGRSGAGEGAGKKASSTAEGGSLHNATTTGLKTYGFGPGDTKGRKRV